MLAAAEFSLHSCVRSSHSSVWLSRPFDRPLKDLFYSHFWDPSFPTNSHHLQCPKTLFLSGYCDLENLSKKWSICRSNYLKAWPFGQCNWAFHWHRLAASQYQSKRPNRVDTNLGNKRPFRAQIYEVNHSSSVVLKFYS